MPKTMRYSTAVKKWGKPKFTGEAPDGDFFTVHHGENERDAWWAETGWQVINVVGFLKFPVPTPDDLLLIGLRLEPNDGS